MTMGNPVESMLKLGVKAWRKVAGDNTPVERVLKNRYRLLKSRAEKKLVGSDFVKFWAGSEKARRIGIYVRGSCDLASMFSCQPLLHPGLDGTCCIFFEGAVWDSGTRLTLQTLRDLPQNAIAPVAEKLKLPANYFAPRQTFSRTITVDTPDGREEFPKVVTVMSIGPDLIRTLYRQKEHGFFVDPGGWWFNQGKSSVLSDLSVAAWFRQNFENTGRITVEEFADNFAELVAQIRATTDGHILVYNVLTIEPGSRVHDYRLVRNPLSKRAREFNLALVELSRKLDVSIVDVDRALKREGVSGQVDYAHFPPELYPAVAKEAVRVMRELGVFQRRA